MLEASKKQLFKAFLRNHKAGAALQGAHNSGKGMLLFYSAECGLKHIVMDDRGYKTTKEVAADFGHNLRKLMTEARISPVELAQPAGGAIQYPKTRRLSTNEAVDLRDVHVAMRYGVELEPVDEVDVIDFLDNLVAAVKRRIVR